MLKLHIQDDEGKVTIVPLVRDEVTIGRQEGNTIRLTERNVSRVHARIRRANGSIIVEDSARYGTRVNGDRVEGTRAVKPGDIIQIGDYRLALHAEDADGATTLPVIEARTDEPEPQRERSLTGVGRAADGSTSIIDIGDLNEILDDDQPREIPAEHRARLLITSTNVKRREFDIKRSPTIIGRTDENDFQIDHRSISRHHAKIVWDEGSYTVLDLESANGVKVNGDLYKRADLHHGDEVELGHVSLKFVAAGKKAAAADRVDDLPVAEVAPSNAGKLALLAIIGVGVAIAIAWFTVFSKPSEPSGRGRTPTEQPTPEKVPPESAAVVAAQGTDALPAEEGTDDPTAGEPLEETAAALEGTEETETTDSGTEPLVEGTGAAAEAEGTGAEEPVESPEEKAKILYEEAKAQLDSGSYDTANQLAAAALQANPKQAGVQELLSTIGTEKTGAEKLAAAKKALAAKDWEKAYDHADDGLEQAPAAKAAAELKKVRDAAADELVEDAVKRGDAYMRQKKYKSASAAYKSALDYDSDNRKARVGLANARRKLKDDDEKPTRPVVKPDKTEKAPKEEPKAGNRVEQARALLDEAKSAKRSSNLPLAKKKLRECISVHGGMSACHGEMAVILLAEGNRCSALKYMRRYLSLAPGGSKAPTFKRMIEQIEPGCM